MGTSRSYRISVVIPAYNEETLLPRCLSAIQPIATRAGAEVIVIDNNSTDRTAEMARRAGVRVITEPQPGVVYALERGLEAAGGEFVAFTDADTIVDDQWLAAAEAALRDPAVVAASGPIRFEHMRFLSGFRWFTRRMIFGSNMMVRRSAALRVGGFNDRYNLASDIALGWALKKIGRIVYAPRMGVTTSARRFQVHPAREGARYILNHVWMLCFHRPLFWNFKTVRRSELELEKIQHRLALTAIGLVALGLFAYYSFFPYSTVFGQVLVRAHTKQKIVALTFDDGPNGTATKKIVDILAAAQVPATFFEVGRSIRADPATTKYVADHGFPIENHSWDHSFRLPYLTPTNIKAELKTTSDIIVATTGTTPGFFRPPHGFRSPQLLILADRLDLKTVDWSVDPQDYFTNNSKLILQRVLRRVRHGSIILLHDGLQDGPTKNKNRDRTGTIEALPKIIEALRARGYTFVTVDELQRRASESKDGGWL